VLDGEHELTCEAEDIYASAHREMDLCGGGAGICLQFAIRLGGRCGLRRRLWGGVGNGVGSYAGPKARRAAETYASRNGATVTAYSVDATRRTITVAVETNSAVEGVDERMTAESTAEIVLGNGVCLKGGKIGFTMDGRCVAKRPDEDPAPESTPSPSPTTAPFKVPDGMSEHARVTTRLVS